MDIKGLVRNIVPLNPQSIKDARRAAKTDSATDRDANGQQPGGEERPPPRKLTQTEIEEAVAHLEALPGVKDNGLRIRLVQKDGLTAVFVEDALGKVVRRIPESELSSLSANKEKASGHILDKAM